MSEGRPDFTLFQSHLDLAHSYWKRTILPGDTVIDATCGNGHDTLVLSQLALTNNSGYAYGIDIQPCAIMNTEKLLSSQLPEEKMQRVILIEGSHQEMPASLSANSVKLIAYNLGYLPGGNKALTTASSSTVASVMAAQEILKPGGIISITCYPGHEEGSIEEATLLQHAQGLSPQIWSCCHHRWINRHRAPSLLIIQKGQLKST